MSRRRVGLGVGMATTTSVCITRGTLHLDGVRQFRSGEVHMSGHRSSASSSSLEKGGKSARGYGMVRGSAWARESEPDGPCLVATRADPPARRPAEPTTQLYG